MLEKIVDTSTQDAIPPDDPAIHLAHEVARAANTGDLPGARAAAAKAEALSPGIAALFLLFQFHFRTGSHADALRVCRLRVERCTSQGTPFDRARSLGNLALIQLMMNDLASSRTALAQALAIDSAHDDDAGLARDLGTLGQLHEKAGDWHAARNAYQRALAHAQRTSDPGQIATKLANLGDVHLALGERDSAGACWRQALPLLEQAGKFAWRDEVAAKLRAL